MCAAGQVHAAPGANLAAGCTGCHGAGGVSVGESIPTIAGLDKRYLMRVMGEFKKDERASTLMGRLARGYDFMELRALASHFAALPWVAANPAPTRNDRSPAEPVQTNGCEECHENQGRYQDHEVPRIAGQQPGYLYLQLLQYRDAALPQPNKMEEQLQALSDADLRALSRYYAAQR